VRHLQGIGIQQVQAVYAGPECDLWQLIMGAQIHVGGLASSQALARRAGITAGSRGVDLCCCRGAGMQFLLRFCDVDRMTGVDATPRMIEEGRRISDRHGLAGRMEFKEAEATRTGLPDAAFDFAWGEDAWCYVSDKPALIAEAARIVRSGGTLAFTDWVEGAVPLSADEARRFMGFMKFPSLAGIADYVRLLEQSGCRVECAEDTGRYADCIDLYRAMLEQQLAFDALAIINFDQAMMEAIMGEMAFVSGLARAGKLAQGMFVARRV